MFLSFKLIFFLFLSESRRILLEWEPCMYKQKVAAAVPVFPLTYKPSLCKKLEGN